MGIINSHVGNVYDNSVHFYYSKIILSTPIKLLSDNVARDSIITDALRFYSSPVTYLHTHSKRKKKRSSRERNLPYAHESVLLKRFYNLANYGIKTIELFEFITFFLLAQIINIELAYHIVLHFLVLL